jgi:plastocyanin
MRTLRNATIGSLLVLLATGVVAQARSGMDGTVRAPAAGSTKTLNIKEVHSKYVYVANTVKVKIGTRVIWKNGTDAPHTITSDKGGLFDKSVNSGKTVSIVFKKLGTFTYHCTIHPYMKGKITVVTH